MHISASGPFLLLIAWLNYVDQQGLVPLAMLACTLHELGHYAAIKALGGKVKSVRLTVVGAEMVLSRELSYSKELLAAAAGPAVNLLLSLLACQIPAGHLFAGINLILAAFNLLPLSRLDGGRITKCALSLAVGWVVADWVGEWIDRVFAGVLLGFGCFLLLKGGSPTLLITASWLSIISYGQEKAVKRACHQRNKKVE